MELNEAKSVLRRYVTNGPYGHKAEPWPESMLEEFIRPQTANPDPFDGPPHPTCGACSRHNDPVTTRRAHDSFDLWLASKVILENI